MINPRKQSARLAIVRAPATSPSYSKDVPMARWWRVEDRLPLVSFNVSSPLPRDIFHKGFQQYDKVI